MTRRTQAFGIIVLLVVVLGYALLRVASRAPDQGEITTDVVVHVGQVTRASLARYVTAYGTVEPEPALDGRPAAGAMLMPYVGGVLAEVRAVEGRQVDEGAVLFRMDRRMADVAVQKASAAVDFAERAFRRQEELLTSDGTSRKAYLEARARLEAARGDLAAARTDLAYLDIVAPIAGTVVRLDATVGQFVDANTVLAQVVDLDRLVVAAEVPGREVEGVAVGQRVLLGPGDSVPEGAVTVLGRDLDPETGTYRVQASIPADAGFLPGQFTEIRIVAEERPDVLVVPEVSVVTRPNEGTWIVVVEGDRAVRRAVTAGLRDGGLVEVSGEGIEEGTRIVTEDAYSLPEETKVRVVGD